MSILRFAVIRQVPWPLRADRVNSWVGKRSHASCKSTGATDAARITTAVGIASTTSATSAATTTIFVTVEIKVNVMVAEGVAPVMVIAGLAKACGPIESMHLGLVSVYSTPQSQ
mmetsp:Transcript_74920/g.189385  ORF Transcript_74920/g.189385 Transcript_74920/m.189385 type:complete len:114 (-) Transcript_74920:151-492(-)